MKNRDTGELIGMFIVITLCLAFLAFVASALYRHINAPYYPPTPKPPTALEQAVESCKKNGGVPYTDYKEVGGYTNEYLKSCDYKPAQ